MIKIQMTGIDHSRATVAERELFSLTKAKQKELMEAVIRQQGVDGCVLLSTCNRTELYVTLETEEELDLYSLLCHVRDIPKADQAHLRTLFCDRSGEEAVRHLFLLTGGLKSRIIGEDQILTQVREALEYARLCDVADTVLKTLFRMAVTIGKKIKTQVAIPKGNTSAIAAALCQLEEQGHCFEGQECLVIGNGEMGRLTARAFQERGANVTVTVRQYHSGEVQIPEGCERIHYGERYIKIPECRYVVSATASPNLTLEKDGIQGLPQGQKLTFIDLAVPRDIDPEIGDLEQAEVFNIDDFQTGAGVSEAQKVQIQVAQKLVEEEVAEFTSWYECKDMIPEIRELGTLAAQDVSWRMGKTFHEMNLSPEACHQLADAVEQTAAKVFQKMLFGVRDHADTDVMRECLDALEQVWEKE